MLSSRGIFMTLLLLLLTGVVKAHLHFLRLAILAAAGLAGLYMVHLLAGDWVKIRPNRPSANRLLQSALKGISKRSLADDMIDDRLNELPTFEEALHQDPLGCARKLVCTLATRPSNGLTQEERRILRMVKGDSARKGSRQFEEAAELGAKTRRVSSCDQHYSKCWFTANQLIKILRSF